MGNICSGSSVGPWWLSYWACQFSHGALKMISYSEWLCKLPECIMLYYIYMGPHWLHHHSRTGKIALGGFRHTLNDYIIVFVLPLHFPKKKKKIRFEKQLPCFKSNISVKWLLISLAVSVVVRYCLGADAFPFGAVGCIYYTVVVQRRVQEEGLIMSHNFQSFTSAFKFNSSCYKWEVMVYDYI